MGNRGAPRGRTYIAIAILLWNLMGVGAFVSQWTMSPDTVAAMPQAEQELWHGMPGWAWAAYAIAVATGTLGAVALIGRKGVAVALFALCPLAVLVQFSYPFVIADAIRTIGLSIIWFPLFILLMAVVQWQLARRWRAQGWLDGKGSSS